MDSEGVGEKEIQKRLATEELDIVDVQFENVRKKGPLEKAFEESKITAKRVIAKSIQGVLEEVFK